MSATATKGNAVLEPELRELCGDLDAVERARTAEKFMRWADQLTESAMRMQPGIIPMVPPPKVPRGFFLLNLRASEQNRLRALAQASGCELRNLLRWAITTVELQMEDRARVATALGIEPHQTWRFINGNPKN
jgi:hypothetical protein